MDTKKWYESKTLWTNGVGVAAMLIQGLTGKQVLDLSTQGIILGIVNFALRLITKSEITW